MNISFESPLRWHSLSFWLNWSMSHFEGLWWRRFLVGVSSPSSDSSSSSHPVIGPRFDSASQRCCCYSMNNLNTDMSSTNYGLNVYELTQLSPPTFTIRSLGLEWTANGTLRLRLPKESPRPRFIRASNPGVSEHVEPSALQKTPQEIVTHHWNGWTGPYQLKNKRFGLSSGRCIRRTQ